MVPHQLSNSTGVVGNAVDSSVAPKLRIEDLRVSLGLKAIISGLSLSAVTNGITLLVGGNGAGKSTVLRAIAGVIPSLGRVFLDGNDIMEYSAKVRHRLGIAYLMQQGGVFFEMTVRENLSIATRDTTRHPDDMLGLPCPGSTWARLWRKPVSVLSIGQQRALAVAMVLNRRPTLALLDEPFSGLALPVAEELATCFRHLVSKEGFTIVLVDHNLHLGTTICDSVFAMQNGTACALPAGISAVEIASLLLDSNPGNPPPSTEEGEL